MGGRDYNGTAGVGESAERRGVAAWRRVARPTALLMRANACPPRAPRPPPPPATPLRATPTPGSVAVRLGAARSHGVAPA